MKFSWNQVVTIARAGMPRDGRWIAAKMRPTQFGDRKNTPKIRVATVLQQSIARNNDLLERLAD